jgi:hypothetical protein
MIIGGSHLVCQDYARALEVPIKEAPGAVWAFVSDGCSGSPDTDTGARLLVLSAMGAVRQGVDPFEDGRAKSITLLADGSARQLGLGTHAIDATLLVIKQDVRGRGFHFLMAGDGAIGLKQRDVIHLLEITYPSGCPYYLSYELDGGRKQAFEMNSAGVIRHHIRSDGHWTLGDEKEVKGVYTCFWPADVGDIAFAVTDGAGSVRKKTTGETTRTTAPVCFTDVIDRLVAFKGTQGQFVSRRMRGFKKEARREDWFNHDDIGLAAIAWEGAGD